jgi:hypothetical protein
MSRWTQVTSNIIVVNRLEDIDDVQTKYDGSHLKGNLPVLGTNPQSNNREVVTEQKRSIVGTKRRLDFYKRERFKDYLDIGTGFYRGDFLLPAGSEGSFRYIPELVGYQEIKLDYADREPCLVMPIFSVNSTTNLRDRSLEKDAHSTEEIEVPLREWVKNVIDNNYFVGGEISAESRDKKVVHYIGCWPQLLVGDVKYLLEVIQGIVTPEQYDAIKTVYDSSEKSQCQVSTMNEGLVKIAEGFRNDGEIDFSDYCQIHLEIHIDGSSEYPIIDIFPSVDRPRSSKHYVIPNLFKHSF